MRKQTVLESGAIYLGQWSKSKDMREGIGKQVWPDGSLYEGNWKENQRNGKGRMIHANGNTYSGDWKND